eukprot:s43_g9.t1
MSPSTRSRVAAAVPDKPTSFAKASARGAMLHATVDNRNRVSAMDRSLPPPEPARPPSWRRPTEGRDRADGEPLTPFSSADYQFMLQATAPAFEGRGWRGQRSWWQDLREMRSYRAICDENRLLRQLQDSMQAEKQRALDRLAEEEDAKQRALDAKQRALDALAEETAAKEQALKALAEAVASKERALNTFRRNVARLTEAKKAEKAWMFGWILCC